MIAKGVRPVAAENFFREREEEAIKCSHQIGSRVRSPAQCRKIFAASLFAATFSAGACEPVIPLMQVVGGPAFLLNSVAGLGVTIALKCILFAALQKPLSKPRAFLLMLAGNILTTIIGILVAAMIGSGAIWAVGIPLVWLLCLPASKRLVGVSGWRWLSKFSGGAVAVGLTILLVVSCLLFIAGQEAIRTDGLGLYWTIKFVAIYLALFVSILLTSFWEEWVIWKLSALPLQETPFLRPVLRANLYVLLIMMAFAATIVLPKRLHSPRFLISRQPEARHVSGAPRPL